MSDLGYLMTVSRNGQVSIPAATRARWRADVRYSVDKVVVVDMGDHVFIRPALKDPVTQLRGVLANHEPGTDGMRGAERKDDVRREENRTSR